MSLDSSLFNISYSTVAAVVFLQFYNLKSIPDLWNIQSISFNIVNIAVSNIFKVIFNLILIIWTDKLYSDPRTSHDKEDVFFLSSKVSFD